MEFLQNVLQSSLSLIIEGGVIVLIAFALMIISKQIIQNIYKQSLKRKQQLLREDFIRKMMRPIYWTIWLVVAAYLIYLFVVRLQPENEFEQGFNQFRNILVILGVTWFSFVVKNQSLHSFNQRVKYSGKIQDREKSLLVSKLLSITIILIAALIVLDTLGVRIGALLALGGVGGLTIGFAARDVFANLFSGFMLHVTKPFSVGDWVHNLDSSMEGIVEHIGFYLTRIRGLDKRPFYVPNSQFASQITVNATRMTNRRIKKIIGIRYDDFHVLEPIIHDLREMLQRNPQIDHDLHQLVDFVEYDESSLNIQIYTFTNTTAFKDFLQVQQDLLVEAGRIIEKHGAEVAYPTSTLHINNS